MYAIYWSFLLNTNRFLFWYNLRDLYYTKTKTKQYTLRLVLNTMPTNTPRGVWTVYTDMYHRACCLQSYNKYEPERLFKNIEDSRRYIRIFSRTREECSSNDISLEIRRVCIKRNMKVRPVSLDHDVVGLYSLHSILYTYPVIDLAWRNACM